MEIWIETGAGVKQGDGPILTATDWTQTARLNAAGEFAFTMPADDPRALLLRPHYWARAWHYEPPTGWRQVGYGRIESVSQSVSPDGIPQLQVSGGDELSALTDRICLNLDLKTHTQRHPSEVQRLVGTNQFGTIDYAVGDTTTADTIAWLSGVNPLCIRNLVPFGKISFLLSTPNTNASELTATYYDKVTAAWEDVTIVDTTITSGGGWPTSLSIDGDITFDVPSNWGIEPGDILYELRLTSTGNMSADISDITIWAWEANPDPLAAILAYAPAGWSLDAVNGYTLVNQRPLSANLLTNSDFELIAGGDTIDDTTTDTFTDWTNYLGHVDCRILAVTGGHGTGTCVKITSTGPSNYAYVAYEYVATAGQLYTLKYWVKGDAGVGQMQMILHAGAVTGTRLLYFDTMATAATWVERTHTFTVPVGVTTLTLQFMLHYNTAGNAAAYLDDVTLHTGGGESIYLQLRDESVLEALRRVAQNTSENFVHGAAAKTILWLGTDIRASGLRAIAAEPEAGTTDPNTLLLVDLQEHADASPLVTRLYPYGGGMGEERVTMAHATQLAPTGYTLDTTTNYLERDAAVTALGIIETTQQWSDVIPADATDAQGAYASNALLWQAWQYLETHSATDTTRFTGDVPSFYSVRVAKIECAVTPGSTIRLSYHRWRQGIHVLALEQDCWLTAVTHSVSAEGVHLSALELATVPRAPDDDNLLIARNLLRLRDAFAHNSAAGY